MTCVAVWPNLWVFVFPLNVGRTAPAAYPSWEGEGCCHGGGHRSDEAAKNLVDAALFDDALFYEDANTLGGIARKENPAIYGGAEGARKS